MTRWFQIFAFALVLAILSPALVSATTTSWIGGTSANWGTASNWTNGVPTASVDAIIGDASFTGPNQPSVGSTSVCNALTVGNGDSTMDLNVSAALTVNGDLTIGFRGALHSASAPSITVLGNWSNSGTFDAGNGSSNVIFAGGSQSINGMGTTTFRNLTINASSTTTLNVNTIIGNSLTVNGTFNPNEPAFTLSGSGSVTVGAGGVLHVKSASFGACYFHTGGTTLNATSTVNYSATTINQTVSNALTYGTLRISGALTKTLGGTLPALVSSSSAAGNIYVDAGTFDLSIFTANRGTTVAGGTVSLAAGASLKIGGTNGYPSNFTTSSLASTSTVEYYGTNQTVAAVTYGNLKLSSSSGAAIKTMPGNPFTVAGTLTSTLGSGTLVSFTAASNITVNGSVNIGASTTFNGGSFSHSVGGNWVNDGTFTGSTSTVTMAGTNATITGAGSLSYYNLTISGSGITLAAALSATVSGNLATSGSGTFTHSAGSGTITMSGASRTITGTGITLSNVAMSGSISSSASFTVTGNFTGGGSFNGTGGTVTMSGSGKGIINTGITFGSLTVSGSVATSATFTVAGDLTVNGTLTASTGTVTMNGSAKAIAGSGTLTLSGLSASGTITTARSFTLTGDLTVGGSFTASAGTVSFTSTSVINGAPNLSSVVFNGVNLRLAANTNLGIAGSFTILSGTVDVYTTTPNTVTFNGSGAQSVNGIRYDRLTLANGGTKSAAGAIRTDEHLTINSGVTFGAGSYCDTIYGDWINNGTFTAGSSTISLVGSLDAAITGATTFNVLEVNKSASTNTVTLNSNISTGTLTMTSGIMSTGANAVTVTSSRTGNGIVMGTITRTHAFAASTAYAFEGPNNLLTFASAGTLPTSVTLTSVSASPGPTTSLDTMRRYYVISQTGGTGFNYTLRLHYNDAEVSAPNVEGSLKIWVRTGTGPDVWSRLGASSSNTTNNWVEVTGVDQVGTFTLSSRGTAAVVLALQQSAANPSPADSVLYTISYSNNGDGSATNTTVTTSVPANTSYVTGSVYLNGVLKTDAADGDEVSVSGSSITINLSTLAAGASGTITYTVRVQ
ncbi:MAG TPA: hypothetical protein VHI13_06920 [Candidatus Kapabacteria bacterium]|nr:hypothetical protein [Candidatus Kapabacteria bacterium]